MKKYLLSATLFVALFLSNGYAQMRTVYVNPADNGRIEIGTRVMPFGSSLRVTEEAYGSTKFESYTVKNNQIISPYISLSIIKDAIDEVLSFAFKISVAYQEFDRLYKDANSPTVSYRENSSYICPNILFDLEYKVVEDLRLCLGLGIGPKLGISNARTYEGWLMDFGDKIILAINPELKVMYDINNFTVSLTGGIDMMQSVPYWGMTYSRYLKLYTPYLGLSVGYFFETD